MHGGVVSIQLVDEHNLDEITDFRTDGRALSALPCRLFRVIGEGCVGVATIQCLLPFAAPFVKFDAVCPRGEANGDLDIDRVSVRLNL